MKVLQREAGQRRDSVIRVRAANMFIIRRAFLKKDAICIHLTEGTAKRCLN